MACLTMDCRVSLGTGTRDEVTHATWTRSGRGRKACDEVTTECTPAEDKVLRVGIAIAEVYTNVARAVEDWVVQARRETGAIVDWSWKDTDDVAVIKTLGDGKTVKRVRRHLYDTREDMADLLRAWSRVTGWGRPEHRLVLL